MFCSYLGVRNWKESEKNMSKDIMDIMTTDLLQWIAIIVLFICKGNKR